MKNCVIVVIVDQNKNEMVMKAAREAGANGGTILRGKGTINYEKYRFLGIEINPDKDVILIITKETKSSEILSHINKSLNLSDPNNGIAFVLKLKDVVGLQANEKNI